MRGWSGSGRLQRKKTRKQGTLVRKPDCKTNMNKQSVKIKEAMRDRKHNADVLKNRHRACVEQLRNRDRKIGDR